MAIFEEANARLFHRVFVCKDCKSKRKANILKVQAGRISCRKCGSSSLRTVRRK